MKHQFYDTDDTAYIPFERLVYEGDVISYTDSSIETVTEVEENGDFYTSDFPIVVEPHVKNALPMYMGLAQYGGELTFPLSPTLMIVVFDRVYFKEKEEYDCTFSIATDKEIRRQNMLRYFYAKRHVFSAKKDFQLIDMIYKLKGHHIFVNSNFKSKIVSGLGKY